MAEVITPAMYGITAKNGTVTIEPPPTVKIPSYTSMGYVYPEKKEKYDLVVQLDKFPIGSKYEMSRGTDIDGQEILKINVEHGSIKNSFTMVISQLNNIIVRINAADSKPILIKPDDAAIPKNNERQNLADPLQQAIKLKNTIASISSPKTNRGVTNISPTSLRVTSQNQLS